MSTIAENQANLLDELDLFQDWTERYEYVIDLGKKLPVMDTDEAARLALAEVAGDGH